MKNMTHLMKRMSLTFFLIAHMALVGLGWHTANGFGQDMKDVGQGIQNSTKQPAITLSGSNRF